LALLAPRFLFSQSESEALQPSVFGDRAGSLAHWPRLAKLLSVKFDVAGSGVVVSSLAVTVWVASRE
jgi:hypothetical protein